MNKKRYYSIILLYVVLIISLFFCFYFGFKNKSNNELKTFKINEINIIDNELHYDFEKNKNADYYEIVVTNDLDTNNYKVTNKVGNISLENVKYGDTLKVAVMAYQKNSVIESDNMIDLIWDVPEFSQNNDVYMETNKDLVISFNGNVADNYKIVIKIDNKVIIDENLTNNTFILKYDLVRNHSGKISAYLYKNNKIIENQNYYINTVTIGKVTIKKPDNNISLWENFTLEYEGGANADNVELKIINNKKLVKTIKLTNTITELNIEEFSRNSLYTLEVWAYYKNYYEIARHDSIILNTTEPPTVKQIYVGESFRSLKPNSFITLHTKTTGAKILYTLDGSNPLTNGKMYTEKVQITENCILKAIGIMDNMDNSRVSTFNINLSSKTPVVYISPSNQRSNLGVSRVGYSNERVMMNKVGDVVVKKLRESGIIVYRNNPDKRMSDWLYESNKYKADLHVAIHSNGSVGHNVSGMEVYVHDEDSLAYSVANLIYNNMWDLYYNKTAKNNRGILFARGRMGEVNPGNLQMGLLIEMAYHDHVDDAKWIVNNINEIGNSIASAIISYFQMN